MHRPIRYHLKRCTIKYLSIRAINVSNAVRTDTGSYSDQTVLHILRLSRQLDKGQCHTSVNPLPASPQTDPAPPFCARCCTESPGQQHNLLSATDIFHLDKVSRISYLRTILAETTNLPSKRLHHIHLHL